MIGKLLSSQRLLPLILLGPILRRSEEKQVCIWLACSKPVTVKAEIFRAKDVALADSGRASPIGSGIAKSLKLGQHLHIVLVIARPDGSSMGKAAGFPTEELLAYDLEIIDDRNERRRLDDLGLLSGKNSIVYDHKVRLPSFFLRGEGTAMNILHGSCRKLHGKGEDCLVAADGLVSSTLTDLSKRPSALFLTGDQIYADDVAAPLIRYLTQLGVELLGWEERITGVGRRLTEIPVGGRQDLVEKYAGFTSPDASNHLLSFGEFAAMYLLAWNVENWPDRFASAATVPADSRKKYGEQVRQLEITRQDLPAVRRLLANIPTYMIFDDHEITDDWNITREWHENVRSSKCGKQVVANGLAAYWAFQGWGNDPALYDEGFVGKMAEYFAKDGKAGEAEKSAFEDHLWDFHGWAYNAPARLHAIVTDCRTMRHYDSKDGPPQLLNDEGLRLILKTAQEADFHKGDPIIIVSPTPVFGFLLIDALQKIASRITGVYKLDLETWYANEGGFVSFLSFILRTLEPSHCIFLSGDVHYGFTISAVFALLQPNENLRMSITQLNSSALKTTSLVKIAFISEILGRIQQLFPLKQTVRTGWVNGGTDRVLSKTLKVKTKPTLHLQIQPRKGGYKSLVQRAPDWVEARSIVKTSGSIIPPLIISDNNVGLVNIDRDANRITHKLLVRKNSKGKVKVHSATVEMQRGKNELEDLVSARMRQMASKYAEAQ
jgi:hypothetical protein